MQRQDSSALRGNWRHGRPERDVFLNKADLKFRNRAALLPMPSLSVPDLSGRPSFERQTLGDIELPHFRPFPNFVKSH
jgi:hypothetical protein